MQFGNIDSVQLTSSYSASEIDDLIVENGLCENAQQLEIIAAQYKLCVEMADRVSARRQTANAFYLSISSTFLAGFSMFKQI